MLFALETVKKRDVVFVIVISILVLILSLIPTGFKEKKSPLAMTVRGKVLDVDDSDIQQFGIVKQGDQGVAIEIMNGPFKGEQVEANNMLIGKLELDKLFKPGDVALVVLDLNPEKNSILYASVIDHFRLGVEVVLLALFGGILIMFAGWTGMKAIVSFAFTAVMIWRVMLPQFLNNWNPILLSLGVVSILTGVIIFLIGGFNKRGGVAFLGAFLGILLTCALSLIFGAFFNIHGAVRPFSETLLYSGFPHLDLRAIFLAGIFLASSGAVMDIAMDIAASMNEMYQKHPDISRKELLLSGLNVGRAVIGTMTTTLLLAYTGGYTSMFMVFIAQGTPTVNVLNLTYVSSEILHTLVGSFGLVLVAPLTAVAGSVLFPMHFKKTRPGNSEKQ